MATTANITVSGITQLPNATQRKFISGTAGLAFLWSADPTMASSHFCKAEVGVDLPAFGVYIKPAYANPVSLTITYYDAT